MDEILIDHKTLEKRFLEHIQLQGNYRILFTAPFGQGKTTFLNDVFDAVTEKYYAIKLFPVNYSVSANEDVFELIKFDILVQLIGKYKEQLKLKEEDFSFLLTSQVYITNRLDIMSWLQSTIGLFGQIGKSAKDFLGTLNETVGDFNKFQKEIQINEISEVTDYLKKIEGGPGSSYEMDSISRLIFDLIQRLKSSQTENYNNEVVLIVDDLDRLDPEHIFRLFNIFSAHFDNPESLEQHNKFGFDKVIFVCDIENIRRIYRHRYGINVDFKGYLDKFFSYLPFEFDNREFINKKVYEFITLMKVNSTTTSSDFFNHCKNPENKNEFFYAFKWFLICLVNSKIMNLRTMVSLPPVEIPDRFYKYPSYTVNTTDYEILWIFYFLKSILGSWELVSEKLLLLCEIYNVHKAHKASSVESHNQSKDYNVIISFCLPFLFERDKGIRSFFERDDPKCLWSNILKCWIHFEPKTRAVSNGNLQFSFLFASESEEEDSNKLVLTPYDVLLKTYNECKKAGFLE
ncbi:P-loop NTPase fold protein [Olivibacter oleidegradans]|uniref:P-loop NTPase fold protein n=1 Tax=Olivibacter oleidegradans TaxID=760123 RepID=A0ABV6HQM1_9SPHI